MRSLSNGILRLCLGAALVAGCGEDSTSTSQATPAPSVSAAAMVSGGDKAKALVRCAAAGERAQEKRADPRAAYAEMVRGCADIYSPPACRTAILEMAEAPLDSGLEKVFRPCRDAYCPLLAAPKPELCSAPLGDGKAVSAAEWQAFTRRMLAHEMGVPEEELPKDLGAVWSDIPVPLEAPTATLEALVAGIELGLDPKGAPIATVESDGKRSTFSLPASPSAKDFKPAAMAAIQKGGAATRVVVRADERIPHPTVVALLDALKREGVTKIAYRTLPAP